MVLLTICACSGSQHSVATMQAQKTQATGLRFVAASPKLVAACRSTARAVAYPVPCPTRVPQGLVAYGGTPGCPLGIISPGRRCPHTALGSYTHASWRGWVVGSSVTAFEHLVITASPTPLRNYAKVVNGPGWYPAARVRPLAWVTVNGSRMRAVYVPEATNDGSAFAHHVVLIWTVGQHTYGVGFHNTTGIHRTLLLDEELARHIKLVRA